jgi:hypothetical protein
MWRRVEGLCVNGCLRLSRGEAEELLGEITANLRAFEHGDGAEQTKAPLEALVNGPRATKTAQELIHGLAELPINLVRRFELLDDRFAQVGKQTNRLTEAPPPAGTAGRRPHRIRDDTHA